MRVSVLRCCHLWVAGFCGSRSAVLGRCRWALLDVVLRGGLRLLRGLKSAPTERIWSYLGCAAGLRRPAMFSWPASRARAASPGSRSHIPPCLLTPLAHSLVTPLLVPRFPTPVSSLSAPPIPPHRLAARLVPLLLHGSHPSPRFSLCCWGIRLDSQGIVPVESYACSIHQPVRRRCSMR